MEWTQQKLTAVCAELQKKAMVDEAFRKELLADPEKAIETLTGEKPPEGFRLKVIENDPAYTATMVLSDFVGRELTDEESDAVSGGLSLKPYAPGTGIGSALEGVKGAYTHTHMIGPSLGDLSQSLLQSKKDPHLNIPIGETK